MRLDRRNVFFSFSNRDDQFRAQSGYLISAHVISGPGPMTMIRHVTTQRKAHPQCVRPLIIYVSLSGLVSSPATPVTSVSSHLGQALSKQWSYRGYSPGRDSISRQMPKSLLLSLSLNALSPVHTGFSEMRSEEDHQMRCKEKILQNHAENQCLLVQYSRKS